MLKLHRQPLAQRVVKNRIAGPILEVREDDLVLLRESRRRPVKIEVAAEAAAITIFQRFGGVAVRPVGCAEPESLLRR